jgi:hypothetical protein
MKTTCLSFLLAACLLIESCSASAHLGKATLSKPDTNEKSEQTWFAYYRDQMDAYGGNAIRPLGEVQAAQGYPLQAGTYNEAAVEGYQQAELDWNVKTTQAGKRTSWALGCGVTSVCLLPILLLIPLMHPTK